MKKEMKRYIFSFIFFSIIGVFMHFIHDIIGNNIILNSLVPINESVWEHMKLIFYPSLFFFVFNYDYETKNTKSTYYASFITAVTFGIGFCILSYYIYIQLFENISHILNIVFYFISLGSVFLIMYLMNYVFNDIDEDVEILAEMLILAYIFIFSLYTYFPPSFDLFKIP